MSELLRLDKIQRNTLSELLAILVLLLTCGRRLRGVDLILYEDNWAALCNVMSGSAGTPIPFG